MINKLIEDQLSKCNEADLSNFDYIRCRYIIPQKTSIQIKVNKEYIVELNKEALDPESIININWNNCKAPSSKYYKISVNNINGKVIQVDAFSYDYENDKDLNKYWSGWLSTKSINILKEL